MARDGEETSGCETIKWNHAKLHVLPSSAPHSQGRKKESKSSTSPNQSSFILFSLSRDDIERRVHWEA